MPNNARLTQREADILVRIQELAPEWAPAFARQLSHFGEHALGWIVISAAGVLATEGTRRRQWVAIGSSAFASHAASVVIKRIVRRPRPSDERLNIGVSTPSSLSFPSSHATSTTAFLVALARTQSKGVAGTLPLMGIPIMMLSRMVLGVHYPTDTVAGAALGAVAAGIGTEIERRTR